MNVDLSRFDNRAFKRGSGRLQEALWLLVRLGLFELCPFGCYAIKATVLRLFGAKVGQGVVIKPGVKITFPWKLELGDQVWLGEECWLLNLDRITIGSHVCISQRAMLCTGSHNYSSPTFDLVVKPIRVETGSWIAAHAWVGPGVAVGEHAVLGAGAVATRDLEPRGIYQGNPAVKTRVREIRASDR
jgi:putative colanic acid biosynthesis acetyltransferase WcaF